MTDQERQEPSQATSPWALAGAGVVSLLVFAGVGWGLRGLREEPPGELAPPASTVAAVAPAVASPHARGRLVFQVQCARCHGPEGRGDGPDAATLRPPPRDLRGNTWHTPPSRESIQATIRGGVPNSMMPGFSASLSASELAAVGDYVLSLAPGGHPEASIPNGLLEKAGFVAAPATRPAPAFTVLGTGNQGVSLEQMRGKLVVAVFWGTRCAPCLKDLPELEELAARFGSDGLAVVPICADEVDATIVRRVASESAPKLPVFVDGMGTAKLSYDVQALPTSVLINAHGDILGQAVGALRWLSPEMEALIRFGLGDRVSGGSETAAKAAGG